MCSSTGRSPTGTSGFGMTVVYGRSRIPSPPARMTALMEPRRRAARPSCSRVGAGKDDSPVSSSLPQPRVALCHRQGGVFAHTWAGVPTRAWVGSPTRTGLVGLLFAGFCRDPDSDGSRGSRPGLRRGLRPLADGTQPHEQTLSVGPCRLDGPLEHRDALAQRVELGVLGLDQLLGLAELGTEVLRSVTHPTTKARSPRGGLGKLDDEVRAELELGNVERDGRAVPRECRLPPPALLRRTGDAAGNRRQAVHPIVADDDQHRGVRRHAAQPDEPAAAAPSDRVLPIRSARARRSHPRSPSCLDPAPTSLPASDHWGYVSS